MHSTTCDIRHMTHRKWRTLSQNVISQSLTIWEWSKTEMGYLTRDMRHMTQDTLKKGPGYVGYCNNFFKKLR